VSAETFEELALFRAEAVELWTLCREYAYDLAIMYERDG
jgi:hypothetical protein